MIKKTTFVILLCFSFIANPTPSSASKIDRILATAQFPLDGLEFLKNMNLKNIKVFWFSWLDSTGVSLKEFKAIHFERNSYLQSVTYKKVSTSGKYKRVLHYESVFHQIGKGNKNNEKWMSNDGKEEYVFKYCRKLGTKIMVTSPVNMGTYNYGTNKATHTMLDVIPWVIFGNGRGDNTKDKYRLKLLKAAFKYMIGYKVIKIGKTPGAYLSGGRAYKAAGTLGQLLLTCNCSANKYDGCPKSGGDCQSVYRNCIRYIVQFCSKLKMRHPKRRCGGGRLRVCKKARRWCKSTGDNKYWPSWGKGIVCPYCENPNE